MDSRLYSDYFVVRMFGWIIINCRWFVLLVWCILFLSSALPAAETKKENIVCDVCVIGGGSAGIGAALAAARAGADVILVEKREELGGTSTGAYVCRWEPGPGCSFAREIYEQLSRLPQSVGVTVRTPTRFGALLIPDPKLTYSSTTQRAGVPEKNFHAVVFDPTAFHKAAWDLLASTEKCRVLLSTSFLHANMKKRQIESIIVKDANGGIREIRSIVFIDCTGGAYVCRDAGCEVMLGEDGRERFNEPHAADEPGNTLNAISLCYRVTMRNTEQIQEIPAQTKTNGWPLVASVHQLPGGDRIVNPLGILDGHTLIDSGYTKAYELAQARAAIHWQWLSKFPEFKGYKFHSFAPMLGIRESYRVITEYILTEHDLVTGLAKQTHPDMIAVADHPMDTHERGGGLRNVEESYGIPYRCLIPKGVDNLLVAGRGAGFSHIAASSCRLSRTMMALGHAAGIAAAEASLKKGDVRTINVMHLVKKMGIMQNK